MQRPARIALARARMYGAGLLLCAAASGGHANTAKPTWSPPVPQAYCQPKLAKQAGTGLAWMPAERAGAPQRWSGWLRVTVQGDYHFLPTAPGVRLRIANQDMPAGGGAVSLPANSWHAVQVSAAANLRSPAGQEVPWAWVPPQGTRQSVPREHLFAPVATIERR